MVKTVQAIADTHGATLTHREGVYTLERVVAERKTFLSRKKLLYRARLRIVEEIQEIHFTELLKETGFGLLASGTGMEPGIGFKKEVFKTGLGPREGRIDEQSALFGKRYTYTFNFGAVRKAIEDAARAEGYAFRWKYFL